MQTAVTTVIGPKGVCRVRVSLDSCSSRSFCRIAVLKEIGAKEFNHGRLALEGIESETPKYRQYGFYSAKLTLANGETMEILVTALNSISCPIDKVPIDLEGFPALKGIPWADPAMEESEMVVLDLNIRLDYYYRIVKVNAGVEIALGLVLLDTRLGCVAGGTIGESDEQECTVVLYAFTEQPKSIDKAVERLWLILLTQN